MANHKSTKKSMLQIEKRTLINRSRKSRIHTFIKKVEAAIQAGDKVKAQESFRIAESEIMKGVTKRVMKLNNAARKVSKLSARVKAMVVSA
jgi:small subunit ribosomal protein S20